MFPRSKPPRRSEIPKVPGAHLSIGDSGALQKRGATRIGRRWTEWWPDLRLGTDDVEELLAYIEYAYSTGIFFDITHTALAGSGKAPRGAGGGTPLINGASQVGEDIATDGWSASVTNVVAAGDVLKIAGLNHVFRVVQSASSNGSGQATIKVNPPLITGSSPADNAAITRVDVSLRATILDYNIPRGRPGQFVSGVSVTFLEAP